MSRALPILGYIAQIVPPRIYARRIGMNAVRKVLHMCGNSLSFKAATRLECLGGPKFADPAAYLESCCLRASLKTITGCEGMHEQLLELAISDFPFGRHNYKVAIPKGWDSLLWMMEFPKENPCKQLYIMHSYVLKNNPSLPGSNFLAAGLSSLRTGPRASSLPPLPLLLLPLVLPPLSFHWMASLS